MVRLLGVAHRAVGVTQRPAGPPLTHLQQKNESRLKKLIQQLQDLSKFALRIRIRKLGLPDPDPIIIYTDPDPSIIKQKK